MKYLFSRDTLSIVIKENYPSPFTAEWYKFGLLVIRLTWTCMPPTVTGAQYFAPKVRRETTSLRHRGGRGRYEGRDLVDNSMLHDNTQTGISLELRGLQRWFTYQNLQDLTRKALAYLLIHEKWAIGIKRRHNLPYPSWSVYLPQVSEFNYDTLYISAARQADLHTTGSCWFNGGGGMPINAPIWYR